MISIDSSCQLAMNWNICEDFLDFELHYIECLLNDPFYVTRGKKPHFMGWMCIFSLHGDGDGGKGSRVVLMIFLDVNF